MRIFAGSPDRMMALADGGPCSARTPSSALVFAAWAAVRLGFDGVCPSDGGRVARVFPLAPGDRLRRVEEAFSRRPATSQGPGGAGASAHPGACAASHSDIQPDARHATARRSSPTKPSNRFSR